MHRVMPIETTRCMSLSSQPSIDELFRLADRIPTHCEWQHSAFSRSRPLDES
jgi:hypothetical protein